ncbi:MAG: hypothetical protein NTY53_15570 [Kiritimatiellaeota bacterium]|nr:hypothetical protein [Kiritimatiellota bacterium]
MKIGSKTRIFAVLGHPIGHTFSPAMHNAAMAELKHFTVRSTSRRKA